ncbi:hypothetical protein JCM8547_004239 [Rhodosporidiobolus lusitaniae]
MQLEEALNVANGARAVLAKVVEEAGEGAELAGSLPGALEEELGKAERAIPGLEERIRRLEVDIAAAVPAPLSPAPPPFSAIANGFGVHSSPIPSSFYPSDGSPVVPPSPFPPASAPEEPTFHASFELVTSLLSQLGGMSSVAERVRGMDKIVETVERYTQIKYELRLEEYLPRCASFSLFLLPLSREMTRKGGHSIFACLSETAGKEVRASVYRLLRHLVVDLADIGHLSLHNLPLFLIRSLARDTAHNLEKEHALRLIRVFLPFARPGVVLPFDGEEVLPVGVLRAVVAFAETVEEKLRLAALETLAELVVTSLPSLLLSGSLRVLLQSLLDGPYDLSPSLSLLFLSAIDHPETRQWLRPGVDLEIVLAGFTEVQPKGAGAEERVRACAGIVGGWLKSWSGLFYLNIHGRQALTSLVDSLTNPSQAIRESLLDMLFSVFNVKTPAWYASRGASRSAFTAAKGTPDDSTSENAAKGAARPCRGEKRRTNLLDQYKAILLLVFVEAGLVEALASLAAAPKDPTTSKKVSLLIAEILELGNRVLPPQHAVRLQALPRLFALTSSFDTSDARLAASEALIAVTAHDRERRVGQLTGAAAKAAAGEEGRGRSNSLDPPLPHSLPSTTISQQASSLLTSFKLQSSLQIDDASFRNLLLSTGVLSTKDHTKWNLDVMVELLEGPLRNKGRMEEAVRASKFMRRLSGFFQPFSLRYCEVRKEGDSAKWTHLGCLMLSTLLLSPDGVQFLTEDKLLRQISDCLFQLDPQLGSANVVETLFSKERIEQTLTSGYFEMLGVLTQSAEGIRLLDQLKIFTAFYRISELRSRDDLVKLIIENMDYTHDGHARVFLAKALTSSYKHIRLFSTSHLSHLLHLSTLSGSSPCPLSSEWQVSLLVQQLYDSAPEVVLYAVEVLERACENRETLEMVVRMRPALDMLGEVGRGLLMRFLSTEVGVRYLHEIDFIERELDEWFNERNLLYVIELELALASVLKTDGGLHESPSTFDGTPPPHFYSELVRTEEGCDIFRDSGHFDHFAEVIQQHDEVELDEAYVGTLKSVLWAVGHIGSTEGGLALLDDEGVLTDMALIAAFSPVYSLRGTATYALALVSQTEEGAEMLDELGWESVSTPICGPTGICVPQYLGDYFFTPLWEPPIPNVPNALLLAPPSSTLERDALTALANLSNHILATKASKTLARLKTRHRSLFTSPSLFYRALDMLASHHYRLATRKYILELFDLPLDAEVAKRVKEAGEELKARKRAEEAGGFGLGGLELDAGEGGEERPRPRWANSGVERILSNGVEGEGTEEEEDDDDDESSADEAGSTIPLKVLTPLVTVRGFLIG